MPILIPSTPGSAQTGRRQGWRAVGPPLLAIALVAMLLCLAAANVVVRATWTDVADGVLWVDRPEGVTAIEIGPDEAGAAAGLEVGDLLLTINGTPIDSAGDVVTVLHDNRRGATLTYTLLRLGEARLFEVTVQPVPAGATQIYFVLAGIGVFTLLVGVLVRLRRPDMQATLHFFWLSVAFFGMFAFSFSGRFDRLDWIFYWADALSTLVLAPMFVHFALVFPERARGWLQERLGRLLLPLVYAPAVVLGSIHAIVLAGGASTPVFADRLDLIWRLEFGYLAACVIVSLALMVLTLQRAPSVTARRQLRWIVGGALLGGLPFVLGYALPWAFGFNPAPLDLTAIPLALIPLAFASAIVRYRLRDVEVIIKRGLVYTAAVSAMLVLYLALLRLAASVLQHEMDGHDAIIAFLATAVVVLVASPLKNASQSILDRVYYRDRYDYRRALVGFASDLNSDLDLNRLAERLVTRVTETLAVDHTVLLLSPPGRAEGGVFKPFHASRERQGGWPALERASSIGARLDARHTVMLDDPASASQHADDEVAFWRDAELHYFVPCVSEEGTIAVLALGARASGEPLSSEDVALLAAVTAQVATAIENGRLYTQLQVKAAEVDRIREFNENIIESLNDGLVVLDLEDRVLRWNAAIERLHGVSHDAAVGKRLTDLFDASFADALRRARDTQPDGAALYRLPLTSRHDAGKQLLVNAAMAPLRTPEGDTAGSMVILEDITDRVRLEEQLQLSDKMASIGLLAAGVAHEVNTPLTGISSFTQMLLQNTAPDDPRTPLLEKIERQTFRAAKIVNGLLNLARPGRSNDIGPVDVHTVINDVLALLEHQLETANIQLRRELSSTPIVVRGVEFKLQQVFLNLFLNARDAMPAGGWLSVTSRIEDGQAVIEVADTGTGVQSETLARIYDPFFTTKPVGRGTGLGLSITYGVIKEHNGSIECQSGSGRGTSFTVTLPMPPRARTQSAARE